MHAYMCVCLYVCLCVRVCLCVGLRSMLCMYTYMHMCACVCVSVYACVCAYMRVCAHAILRVEVRKQLSGVVAFLRPPCGIELKKSGLHASASSCPLCFSVFMPTK